ncbi:hypothetical protein [Burkholderia glumae]|uniref:hypothetical protein n=1 Tax=Burkholderia glumae TaxID=337 RepID=UPI00215157E2|nr:hypothetical protein [Burkholderia glumae]
MTPEGELNIFRCLDFIRDTAPAYGKAKAQRVYLENFRKSKKALLMRQTEIDGHKTAAMQEREAYSNPEYIELLEALRDATAEEERLRWMMTGAEAKIEVWRTTEATKRAEARNV